MQVYPESQLLYVQKRKIIQNSDFKNMKNSQPNIFHSDQNLPGRDEAIVIPDRHFVNGASIKPPFPEGSKQAMFGLGCFCGAER